MKEAINILRKALDSGNPDHWGDIGEFHEHQLLSQPEHREHWSTNPMEHPKLGWTPAHLSTSVGPEYSDPDHYPTPKNPTGIKAVEMQSSAGRHIIYRNSHATPETQWLSSLVTPDGAKLAKRGTKLPVWHPEREHQDSLNRRGINTHTSLHDALESTRFDHGATITNVHYHDPK